MTIKSVLQGWEDTGDTINSLQKIFDSSEAECKCVIRVSSDAILFLEFGSGPVGDSSSQHPKSGEFGYGAYTFNRTYTQEEMEKSGWYYESEHGGSSGKTFGIPALMPMYRGGKKMEQSIMKVARKVFG